MFTNDRFKNLMENDGYMKISNKGCYVAYFNLIYTINKGVIFNDSYQIPVCQSSTLLIPCNAKDIHLSVYYAIYFSTWFIMNKQYFPCPVKKCYTLYGTISNPSCIETPCSTIF